MEEKNKLIDLITQDYISIIFSYALRRTNIREDAEDLAQDILSELISAVANIRNPKAYNGFIWAVANNTYKRWLKKRKKNRAGYLEDYLGLEIFNVEEYERIEDGVIYKEELNRLRWELSLLSKTYRDIVILYYVEEKSCGEIAKELELTVDNVKYFLYKARNIMKDGINMNRELGEKSYKPAEFSISYWGEYSAKYYNLSKRKLPGNILLTAMAKSISISEISIETGVPVAYLEDEVNILEEEGFLKNVKADKYQTSIIIFTKKMNKDVDAVFKEYAKELSPKLYEKLLSKEEEIKKLFSVKNGGSIEKLLWDILPIMLSATIADSLHPAYLPALPLLSNGNHGWLWGSEETNKPWDWSVTIKSITQNAGFGGKYAVLIDFTILNTENQKQIGKEEVKLLSKMFEDGIEISSLDEREKEVAARMIENNYAINVNGVFKFRGSIFNHNQGEEGKEILRDVFTLYDECIKVVNSEILKLILSSLPKHLQEQAADIAYVKTISGMMSAVMEEMVNRGYLHVPASSDMYPIGCYIRI
ncbi:RNA polymerase sigma factor, sigma-70 family [Hathewaya proteolytica DSM 3090]|uniref:RNA polymerase sigma factor, sigma-70 family n=1 Tax=Hathewaya proteolytica DSM 3090 TaxID=1121331 RepID=A0A1M6MW06_9CLOT|nr:sigma-70 family RNA polymerase sigma factor [Hathewaya proteolytica]SHJ87651.1 RNA polymerase sigma factor, sigma-70 family [Hathewaya proteolytica DSM 3090]